MAVVKASLTVLFIVLYFLLSLRGQHAESALGEYPLPKIIPMTGCAPPGFVLASGELKALDYQLDDGFVLVDGYSLLVQKGSMPVTWQYVRELRGQQVELVLRKLEPRVLKEVAR